MLIDLGYWFYVGFLAGFLAHLHRCTQYLDDLKLPTSCSMEFPDVLVPLAAMDLMLTNCSMKRPAPQNWNRSYNNIGFVADEPLTYTNSLADVYVRPAGSYIMDRLELRRVVSYPGVDESDVVILVGNFSIPTGLRNAEAALLNRQEEAIPECQAVVFPMVKHPFIVGFLVAELPDMEFKEANDAQFPSPSEYYTLPPSLDLSSPNFQTSGDSNGWQCNFSAEQTLNATNISRSLAMAHVMDQLKNGGR